MSATPLFAGTLKQYGVSLQSAETSRVTPTNFATLIASTADDVIVPGINFKASSTTAAGIIFFYLYDGSTYYIIHEETFTAISPTSTTTTSFEGQYVPDLPLLVPTGWSLRFAITDATSAMKFTTINAAKV